MTITAHPVSTDTYAVVCEECGPVSMETVASVHRACIEHLIENHEAVKVQVKLGDDDWEEA